MDTATSTLTGAALDWAVAKLEKHRIDVHKSKHYTELRSLDLTQVHDDNWILWNPSDDWAQGGPIIERERIELVFNGEGWDALQKGQHIPHEGATPLIAAMRCYVASKLGDTVFVPTDLKG